MIRNTSPSPNKGQRNSSIELYRIIASFTVLIVHFNGWFVEMPDKFDVSNPTLFRTGQMVIEAATCICVNMFLLISGYFGIRLRLQSVLKLCLLLAFIYVPFYIVESIAEGTFLMKALASRFLVISAAGYFIQGYFMLMFFSPMLNAFIEKFGKQTLPWTLLFLTIEFWFGCVRDIDNFGFNHGYSVIHFVLMYMVARCIALYKDTLMSVPRYCWICGYMVCTCLICAMYVMGLQCTFDYSNPIVVLSSVCSFVPFLYKEYHNRFINWIAGGTLAVYIIQVTNPVMNILISTDKYLLGTYSYPVYLLLAAGVIIVTFIISVLYHHVCTFMINPMMQVIEPKVKDIKMM